MGKTQSQKEPAPKITAAVNVKKLNKQLAGIMAHLEQHPHDVLSRARVDKIKDLLSRA